MINLSNVSDDFDDYSISKEVVDNQIGLNSLMKEFREWCDSWDNYNIRMKGTKPKSFDQFIDEVELMYTINLKTY